MGEPFYKSSKPQKTQTITKGVGVVNSALEYWRMAFASEKGETCWLIQPIHKEKPLEEVHVDYLQEATDNAGARDASGREI